MTYSYNSSGLNRNWQALAYPIGAAATTHDDGTCSSSSIPSKIFPLHEDVMRSCIFTIVMISDPRFSNDKILNSNGDSKNSSASAAGAGGASVVVEEEQDVLPAASTPAVVVAVENEDASSTTAVEEITEILLKSVIESYSNLNIQSCFEKKNGMIELNIATEEHHRTATHECTKRLLDHPLMRHVGEMHLRRFLAANQWDRPPRATRNSTAKLDTPRAKMARLMSDLLFNASHAFYAWRQCESELLLRNVSEEEASSLSVDERVYNILFVSALFSKEDRRRALKRFGGIQNYSVLTNALHIARARAHVQARAKNVLWSQNVCPLPPPPLERSNRKNSCKRSLSNGSSHQAQQRQRSNSNASVSTCTVTSGRSRSFSLVSQSSSNCNGNNADDMMWSATLDNFLEVKIQKNALAKWGVTLARFGKFCLVHRTISFETADAIHKNKCDDNHNISDSLPANRVTLFEGDIIESVSADGDENGSVVSGYEHTLQMFRAHDSLKLIVKRVASL